jgi:hypothetical protein
LLITYEGKSYEFDMDDLDVFQALKIEKHIDGPMIEWEKGMLTGRALCVQVLGWLILHGGDLDMPIASVNFKYSKLATAFTEAAQKEAEAEAAKAASPDPTGGGRAAASNGRKSARVSSPSGSAT